MAEQTLEIPKEEANVATYLEIPKEEANVATYLEIVFSNEHQTIIRTHRDIC